MTSTRMKQFMTGAGALVLAAIALLAPGPRAGARPQYGELASRKVFVDDTFSPWRVSPDGRHMAVTDSSGNLALRELASGRMLPLTKRTDSVPGSRAGAARFAPDGGRIAFAWRSELRVIGTDGAGERVVLTSQEGGALSPLDWSPDGLAILAALRRPDRTAQLGIVPLAGGPIRHLTKPEHRVYRNAAFSPDGRSVIFDAPQPGGGGSDIYEVAVEGGRERPVIEHPANDELAAVSLDGKWLLFTSDRTRSQSLWACPAARCRAGVARLLKADFGRTRPLGITRDGTMYYRSAIAGPEFRTAQIDPVRMSMKPPRVLIGVEVASRCLPHSWTQNARHLLMRADMQEGWPALAIYDVETGEARAFPVRLRSLTWAHWKGADLVVEGVSRGGESGLYAVDPATGDASLLVASGALGGAAGGGVWSREGRIMYNTSMKRPGTHIFRYEPATARREVLYAPEDGVDFGSLNLALSPDGRDLAFQKRNLLKGEASLAIIPVEGGEPRSLLEIRRPDGFMKGPFAWMPDGRAILAAVTRGERTALWIVPVDGSGARKIGDLGVVAEGFHVRSDGQTVVFRSTEYRDEIRALDRCLPAGD